jgi:hypothetical protein
MNTLPARIVGDCIVTFLTLGTLAALVTSPWRLSRLVSEVFARHQFDEPSLETIRAVLDKINAESPTYMFTALRIANILFRGQHVCLVYGPVGFESGGGRSGSRWRSTNCVCAIADADQRGWMEKNRDAFKPAFTTPTYSVFWVTLSKFKTPDETNRQVLGKSAPGMTTSEFLFVCVSWFLSAIYFAKSYWAAKTGGFVMVYFGTAAITPLQGYVGAGLLALMGAYVIISRFWNRKE